MSLSLSLMALNQHLRTVQVLIYMLCSTDRSILDTLQDKAESAVDTLKQTMQHNADRVTPGSASEAAKSAGEIPSNSAEAHSTTGQSNKVSSSFNLIPLNWSAVAFTHYI